VLGRSRRLHFTLADGTEFHLPISDIAAATRPRSGGTGAEPTTHRGSSRTSGTDQGLAPPSPIRQLLFRK
jgi:hypothetical protein